MRTIVAVRGVANLGKSASIKKTYQLLKSAYPNAIFDEIVVSTDITIIIAINGVKIGIESQGDPNRRLFSSLNRFVQAGCKVIVCATRSRGKTLPTMQWRKKSLRLFNRPLTHNPSFHRTCAKSRAVR